jgi:hypothetical protein
LPPAVGKSFPEGASHDAFSAAKEINKHAASAAASAIRLAAFDIETPVSRLRREFMFCDPRGQPHPTIFAMVDKS